VNKHDVRAFLTTNKEYEKNEHKGFDFVGVGRWNRNKTYREYGQTVEDAILAVCTGHRLSPRDIELVVRR
jgi:hypothetical protein